MTMTNAGTREIAINTLLMLRLDGELHRVISNHGGKAACPETRRFDGEAVSNARISARAIGAPYADAARFTAGRT